MTSISRFRLQMNFFLLMFNVVEEMSRDDKKDRKYPCCRRRMKEEEKEKVPHKTQDDHRGLADLCWLCQAVSDHVRPQRKLCKSEAGGDYWDYRPDWCWDWKHAGPAQPSLALGEPSHHSTRLSLCHHFKVQRRSQNTEIVWGRDISTGLWICAIKV